MTISVGSFRPTQSLDDCYSWDHASLSEPILSVTWIDPQPIEIIKTSLNTIPSFWSH